jgi:hypothetical protein
MASSISSSCWNTINYNGVSFDMSKKVEFRRYVLGSAGSHMLAILQDGIVKEFIICVNLPYKECEILPLNYCEVGCNTNSLGLEDVIYETNCSLKEFERLFVHRHGWMEIEKGVRKTPTGLYHSLQGPSP